MRHLLKILLVLLIVRSNAGYSSSKDAAGMDVGSEVVTTRHTLSLRGSPLAYIARAGFIPILDEASGDVHAKIFFVSYTAIPQSGGPARPLTFVTAGGPGEPAALGELHFRSDVPYDPGTLTLIRGWRCSTSTANCVDPQALVNLQHAMRANPSLQVMITSGYYDLNCPYFGTKLALSHFDSDLRARVNVIYYQAGHHVPPEHRAAVARFIQGALATSRKTGGVHAQSSR
jgi:carboxypeptidase C (cathepsin A)